MNPLKLSTIHSGEGVSYRLLTQEHRAILSEITRFCYTTAWADNSVHPSFNNCIACFTEEDCRKLLKEGSVVDQ